MMTDDEYDAVYSLLREGFNSIPFNRRVHSNQWKELLAHISLKHTNPGKCQVCNHKCHLYAGGGGSVHGHCYSCDCKNCRCNLCELKYGRGFSNLTIPIKYG
jgi:hypothetical protein